MKADLNCVYEVPFEICVYHEAQAYALKHGFKWCRLNGNVLSSLRKPYYSLCLPKNTAIRFRRWLDYVRK